jgi:hypothetical protein
MTLQGGGPGGWVNNVSNIIFFTFRNFDFKTFGSEKFCLTAGLGFKRYFIIIHLAVQIRLKNQ